MKSHVTSEGFFTLQHMEWVQHMFARKSVLSLMSAALIFLAPQLSLFAQPSGGVQGELQVGPGARALALGSAAFVALPGDASSIYWNPGGLDQLSRGSVTLFHTNLLGGATYNYLGIVQPTLTTGTFGIGIIRVGIDGVDARDESNNSQGTLDYSHLQLLFAYSKQLPFNLSLGFNFKISRQALGKQTASGIGADFGMLYAPDFDSEFLQNLKFGLTIQNILEPELRLGTTSDKLPYSIRFGAVKPFLIGGDGDAVNLLFGVEQGDKSKLHLHSGAEYVYRGMAMLRTGISRNDSSAAQLSFGAGLIYQRYHLDYSFGKFFPNELTSSHRLSLTVDFGHSREEMARIAEDRRLAAIEKEVIERQRFQRNLEFQNHMDAGKAFYDRNEFFSSYIEFSAARQLDPANEESDSWVGKVNEKLAAEQKTREAELSKQAQAEAAKQEVRDFVESQFKKGMNYFEAGRYSEAIQEWRRGLERDPQNVQITRWLEETRKETTGRIADMFRRADALAREGKYLEAIQILQQMENMGAGDGTAQKDVQDRITRLQRLMAYQDLYRQGLTEYINKNYVAAVGFFAQALKTEPNNEKVKKYYNDSEARANARVEDFANESIRGRFIQAQQQLQSGQYAQALDILESIQKEQRYNKRILDAIDLVRERLKK